VVVTDFVLGWTNGLSVLREVKSRYPECPVIMFTADGNESVAVEGMKAGLDDYVIRSPAHRARLLTAVQAALDRMRARLAAREAEARYRTLFDSVPVGLFRAGPDGRLLEANAALRQMLGLPADGPLEPVDLPSRFVDAADGERWRAQLAANGVVRGFEARLRRADGSSIWVRGSARIVRGVAGAASTCEGEMEDIHESRCAAVALEENRARLDLALDVGRMAAWDMDVRNRTVNWHRGTEIVLGLEPGQRIETEAAFLARVHPEDRDRVRRVMEKAIGSGESLQDEFRVVRADGGICWLATFGRVFRDEAGRPLRVVGAAVDITQRRQAEEAMRASEERFRQIAGAIREVFWLATVDYSEVLYVSPSFETVWGRPCESVFRSRRCWLEFVHPEDRHRLDPKALSCAEGCGHEVEYRIVRPDGAIRWIRDRAFPVRDASGVVYRCAGIAEDVTERRESEAALRVSRERLALAIDAARLDVWEFDFVAGRFTESADRLLGVPPGQTCVTEDDFFRLVLPGDREAVRRAMARAIETGAPYEAEFRVAWPDGSEHWLYGLGRITRDADGRPLVIRGVTLDITERRRSEEAIRASEEKYRRLVETANDAVFLADAETGLILDANQKAAELLGLPVEKIVGLHQTELHPPDQAEIARSRFQEAGRGGGAMFSGLALQGRDGRRIPVEVSASVIESGGRRRVLGLYRDVTERQQLEEQVRHAQRLDVVGRLAGGVAHDFNNLLSVIVGFGQLARQGVEPASAARRYLDEVLRAAQRAEAITRQLLAFSRRQVLKPTVFDLAAVVSGLEPMIRRLVGERVTLKVSGRPGLGGVRADTGQIEQVVLNLAVNARDAMPDGGLLAIDTDEVVLDAASAGLISGAAPGAYLRLRVTDTGRGMDAETRRHIFEPFFTTKEQGTGLGLSTVYGIVRQSGGFLDVDSAPGRGARFDVYLPRVPLESAQASSGTLPAVVSDGSETVLLVEDDEVVRAMVREVLQCRGYTVLEAAGPSEALEAAGRHAGPIPLLVTDVGLPDASGLELARQMARIRPGIRVLFISGYLDDGFAAEAAAVGPLLRKPFTPDALARRVREALDGGPPGPA